MSNKGEDEMVQAREEVLGAIAAILEKDFTEEAMWLSVGLLNIAGKIDWASRVLAACPKAGCTPNDKSRDLPPCHKAWLANGCQFREDLSALEKVTMEDFAHSLGRLSLLYYLENLSDVNRAPYIFSCKDIEQPFVGKARKDIQAHLINILKHNNKSHLWPKTDIKNYELHVSKCTPAPKNEHGFALVPLMQHISDDDAYIGAIVVCAKKNSQVWRHLPRLKATALSLLETRRHLHVLYHNSNRNIEQQFMTLFFKHLDFSNGRGSDNWFFGQCKEYSCTVHNGNNKDRHSFNDCRLGQEKIQGLELTGELHSGTRSILKSLLEVGKRDIDWEKRMTTQAFMTLESHMTNTCEVTVFVKRYWGVDISSFGNDILFNWPLCPGLITLLGLMNVLEALKERKEGEDAKNVRMFLEVVPLTYGEVNRVTFAYSLDPDKNPLKLAEKLAQRSGGKLTSTILDVCHGRLQYLVPDKLEGKAKKRVNDLFRGSNRMVVTAEVQNSETEPMLVLSWLSAREKKTPSGAEEITNDTDS